jgi:hypothetical protein
LLIPPQWRMSGFMPAILEKTRGLRQYQVFGYTKPLVMLGA